MFPKILFLHELYLYLCSQDIVYTRTLSMLVFPKYCFHTNFICVCVPKVLFTYVLSLCLCSPQYCLHTNFSYVSVPKIFFTQELYLCLPSQNLAYTQTLSRFVLSKYCLHTNFSYVYVPKILFPHELYQ